ncbi:hypothetical protein BH11MYX4_BH11MYX4_61950 [soil metagenome]
MSRLRNLLPVAPLALGVLFAMTSAPRRAEADPTSDAAEKAERCATRLYTTMVGDGASTAALASPTPQAMFDTLVKDPAFVERFSRYINSQFNRTPGTTPSEDASYYMTKYVLTNDKPWSDMFVGAYDVVPSVPAQVGSEATVQPNANGLGYFRSRQWAVRYAGNETAGIRIVSAYRMMQNTIGLKLSATTNSPDVDISATGRKSAQCAGCHYTPWFALDKVAAVLGTRTGTANATVFNASTLGPQVILGGVTISNDKELVQALVSNEAFDVNACRIAYGYLYGRAEYTCEGKVFDACVAAFKKDKLITSALAVVAKDPTFCE